MAITRSTKVKNFTVIDNSVLQDNFLSFEAIGLLTYLLSKPDEWNVLVAQLAKVTVNTRKNSSDRTIRSLLDELESKGFVASKRLKSGHMDYRVFDTPQESHIANSAKSKNCKEQILQTADSAKSKNCNVLTRTDNYKQELIKESKGEVDANASTPTRNQSSVPFEHIANLFNQQLGNRLPNVQVLNTTRKRIVAARWHEMLGSIDPNGKTRFTDQETGLQWFERFFSKASKNGFWMGDNDKGFAISFDWIFKASNFIKILEWRPAERND